LLHISVDSIAFIYLAASTPHRPARSAGLDASPTGLDQFRTPEEDDRGDEAGPASKKAKLTRNGDDDESPRKQVAVEEHLLCPICQETLHEPACAMPCLHNFCGGCISQWLKLGNSNCPECRDGVKEVKSSHKLSSLVSAYLEVNPEKARPNAELEELSKLNAIEPGKPLKIEPGKPPRVASYAGSSEYGSSEEYDEDDDDDEEFGHHSCRACDTEVGGYQCPPGSLHTSCAACLCQMPRNEIPGKITRCQICTLRFCDSLFGCDSRENGLKPLQERAEEGNTGCVVNVLDNAHETSILSDYLATKNLTADGMLKVCLDRIADGTMNALKTSSVTPMIMLPGPMGIAIPAGAPPTHHHATGESQVCLKCYKTVVKTASYEYRAAIPSSELPAAVMNRDDCWYGRDCRTMRHNPSHSQRLNHICVNAKGGGGKGAKGGGGGRGGR